MPVFKLIRMMNDNYNLVFKIVSQNTYERDFKGKVSVVVISSGSLVHCLAASQYMQAERERKIVENKKNSQKQNKQQKRNKDLGLMVVNLLVVGLVTTVNYIW